MKINDYFDRVIVINLDKRTDRLEKITAELDALGIEFERLSAVDAVAQGIRTVIACMQSHIKAAEMAAGSFHSSFPLGPSTSTELSLLTATLTLAGIVMGFLPIRDMDLTRCRRAIRRQLFVCAPRDR